MNLKFWRRLACVMLVVAWPAKGVERFVSLDGGHVPPFLTWADAATNIQAAIDAASPGDVIWVTNGVYSSGGKVMAGDLINRVALDKAVTVQSVNGPDLTIIQGQWDPVSTNGPAAVRCAWVTNGATLSGFTLSGGATRFVGDLSTLLGGGGVWCSSSNATVANCRISRNAAQFGGGSFGGTLINCQIDNNFAGTNGGGAYSQYIGGPNSAVLVSCKLIANVASSGGGAAFATLDQCTVMYNRAEYGGGVYGGTLNRCHIIGNNAATRGGGLHGFSPVGLTANNCRIAQNSAGIDGGGVYSASVSQASLKNCTITGNTAGASGGGTFQAALKNCIVFYNHATNIKDVYGPSSVQYTCMSEAWAGTGNITLEPLFLADGYHLSSNSPCRGAGSSSSSEGTDMDGQSWANPPSMGCDEWRPEPAISPLTIGPAVRDVGQISISGLVAGEGPFGYSWSKDGTNLEDGPLYSGSQTTRLMVRVADPAANGNYQLIVTNALGSVTSQVANITLHFVDPNGLNPTAPYATWQTAAMNIQDAVAAAEIGDIVVVTNGVYATGGIAKEGLTNRVMLDKAVTVQSVNGPAVTIIQGSWHPGTTNGPSAVRCAWLADGAALGGFTLRNGATLADASSAERAAGGGVRCVSTNAVVANCVITENSAHRFGGGAYSGFLLNCLVTKNNGAQGGGAYQAGLNYCRILQNSAITGGGAYQGTLFGCAIQHNRATTGGGGAYDATLIHCTITHNTATSTGGADRGVVRNCIVQFNGLAPFSNLGPFPTSVQYTCSSPRPNGIGNLDADPGLMVDGVHLRSDSPCRGAGNLAFTSGTDIDGQSWSNPPSMGCDEWQPEPVIVMPPRPSPSSRTGQVLLKTEAAGQPPFTFFWIKDGELLQDGPAFTNVQSGSLAINNFGASSTGNYQVIVSNVLGTTTSQVVHVGMRCVDVANAAPMPPFTTWETAAATIQDAIEAAEVNDVILVTNGVYAVGGKVIAGDLTNRVAVHKPILVTSVNGPEVTIIEGQKDPASTNGPAAIRCAWMTDGAGMSGFTLRNGATRASPLFPDIGSGGGVSCMSTNAELANCVIENCSAANEGGGVLSGTVMNSVLNSNSARYGGGAAYGILKNCRILDNTAVMTGGGLNAGFAYNSWFNGNTAARGGGSDSSHLVHCTVTGNSASNGGGCFSGTLTNCIVYFNSATTIPNFGLGTAANSCVTPLPPGVGNISDDPQLVDGFHLSASSPCRGMGTFLAVAGTDLDGEAWANPPSMGCDEIEDASFAGPLSVHLTASFPTVAANGVINFVGEVTGLASRLEWSFGDGLTYTNLSYLAAYSWTEPGDYTVTFTAYNADLPEGVSTNLQIQVVPFVPPAVLADGLAGTNFSLSFLGQPGITYIVEQTTNLTPPIAWQPVRTLFSTGALMQVTDTRATNAMRFYRVRIQ